MPKENMKFEIKYSNWGAKDICAICGCVFKPNTPLAIFAMGTWKPICYYCAEKYAPELYDALDLFYTKGGIDKYWERGEVHMSDG